MFPGALVVRKDRIRVFLRHGFFQILWWTNAGEKDIQKPDYLTEGDREPLPRRRLLRCPGRGRTNRPRATAREQGGRGQSTPAAVGDYRE